MAKNTFLDCTYVNKMIKEQKTVSLTNGELKKQVQAGKTRNILTVVTTVVGAIFLVPFMLGDGNISPVFIVLIVLILAGVPVFVILASKKFNKSIREDYQNGKKIVIKGYLQDKRIGGTPRYRMYYFYIGNYSLKVSSKVFSDFEKNSPVEIHIAPKSQFVINVKKWE